MNKSKWTVAWTLIAFAMLGIVVLAASAGYTVGSDMAERDNRAETR